jgi:hypothetical protein
MPTGLGGEVMWLCPSLDDSPNDLSGNGNNGTYVNGTSTVADSDPTYGGSRAYNFDGTNDYINCGTATSPADLSMSVWVNVLSFSNKNKGIVGTFNSGGTSDEYGINASHVGAANSALGAAYGIQAFSPSVMPQNTWHHLVLLRDTAAGFVRLYENGVLVTQTAIGGSTPPVSATKDFIIGRYGGTQYFGGLMDDVRKYDRAITQAEVTLLASTRGFTTGGDGGGTHVHRTLLGVG